MKPYEMKIKADNLKAHLLVMKSAVKAQEASLESVLVSKENAEDDLTDILRDTKNANENLMSVKENANQITRGLNNREELLDKREKELNDSANKLVTSEEDFEEYKKEELSRLDVTKQTYQLEIGVLVDRVKDLKRTIETQTEFCEKIRSTFHKDRDALTKDLENIKSEIKDAEDTLSDATESLLSVLKQKEDATYQLDKMMASTKTLRKNIEDRETAVDQKEKDVKVIARRVEKEYKRLFPERKIRL